MVGCVCGGVCVGVCVWGNMGVYVGTALMCGCAPPPIVRKMTVALRRNHPPLSLDGTQHPPSLLQLRLRPEDVTELDLGAALAVVAGAEPHPLARTEVEDCCLGGGP